MSGGNGGKSMSRRQAVYKPAPSPMDKINPTPVPNPMPADPLPKSEGGVRG